MESLSGAEPTDTPGFVVEVNEGLVEASGRGVDWWTTFRLRFHGTYRIRQTVAPYVVGGRCEVACDDRAHAEHLAAHMVEFGGLPPAAVRVKPPSRTQRDRRGLPGPPGPDPAADHAG